MAAACWGSIARRPDGGRLKGIDTQPLLLPDEAGGHRFCLLLAPARSTPHALVLHAQALGGEQNLARRQVNLTARAWAEAGAAVLVVDLAGCGDSTGDTLGDPWGTWDDDLRRGAAWLRTRWPGVPLWGWGLRGGALALAPAWPAGGGPEHWLFWQPLLDGADLLRHWQRQATASALAEGREGRTGPLALQAAWDQGLAAEAGGAAISAPLARGAAARTLEVLPAPTGGAPGRVACLEVNTTPRAAPVPRTAACLQRWQEAGWQVTWHGVEGPPFWLGPEVATLPALTAATLQAVGPSEAGR